MSMRPWPYADCIHYTLLTAPNLISIYIWPVDRTKIDTPPKRPIAVNTIYRFAPNQTIYEAHLLCL